MSLNLQFGYATATGPRACNEDFGGFVEPADSKLAATKGMLAVVADGVSGGSHGREAAETSVRNLLADYYATPDTWETPHALGTVLAAINRWLTGQTASRHESGGMATTLTSLVLRGRRFHYAHVGDTRLYRLRGETLDQLTVDHVWETPGMSHVLKRALGLDTHVRPDFGDGELVKGDRFVIVCDGVWEPLGQLEMHRLLKLHDDVQRVADALVEAAHAHGGQDNATALVVQVSDVGADVATLADARDLPLPGKLNPGARLDDFVIEDVLHSGRDTLIYRARHDKTGQRWALKSLQPILAGDPDAANRLLAEEWFLKRVHSHYFPDVLALPGRNFLYFAVRYYEGATLQDTLDAGQHFSPVEAVTLMIRVLKGLAALHRLDIVHRDIKPANLHVDHEGKLRILDLGVARCPTLDTREPHAQPGTPSYMAPELFNSVEANPQTDLYAVGVSIYHLLTRKYPYGEIEPFQRPKFGEPAPPARTRPDIPPWLENVLLKAVARDPAQRFETAEEMLLALERGEANPLLRRRTPLIERSPAGAWPLVAVISITLNLLLLFVLLAS
ncbi:MAG: bifunctional protein-serine/threonine kinase/phosphatase [Thiobacillus sp.]|nr:bifunctional protein-serine/threonine kinase/phosphatase [Thiobacillus sp.]